MTLRVLITLLLSPAWAAADWPTFRHDNFRSGKTPESVEADSLARAWRHQGGAPQQAWAGPAKWDAYAGIRGLRSMRNYDPVHHVTSADGRVYYGSSADDSVRCLDAKTGEELWVVTTDGPVRVAPTIYRGKAYFGSDDGCAYCVDAATGERVWKYRPAEPGRLILNNGRFIPFHPVRTGVMIDRGKAYFAAGLLPWRPSFLCSVDAATGKADFANRIDGVTFEGPLLCSKSVLIAPQGRVPPLLFSRKTGAKKGQLKGGGGSFVLVTSDDHILHGPGNKTGWITDSAAAGGAKLASFSGANAMVVHGDVSYVLSDSSLRAIDRKTGKSIWTTPCRYPYELILANDTIFAGGRDEVGAFDAGTGERVGKYRVFGKAYGLAVADGALFVSTDEGHIDCFRPGEKKQVIKAPKAGPAKEAPVEPVAPVKEPGLISRWVFQRNAFENGKFRDQSGGQDGLLFGNIDFQRLGKMQALKMDGSKAEVTVAADYKTAKVPTESFTATAWVRVDQPRTWGGFIGAIQDNGSFERGFLLGYLDDHFGVAVNGKGGPDKLTYLKAKTKFKPGAWYHVAGTYDGRTLRVFVNGELQAESAEQSGRIHYPPEAPLVIGAYHDKNEFYPLEGQLHEVRLYDRALAAKGLAKQFREKAGRFPDAPVAVKPVEPAAGPYLRFTSPTTSVVRYKTSQPVSTKLTLRLGERVIQSVTQDKAVTDHEAVFRNLRRDTQYEYVVGLVDDGRPTWSPAYECDTFFNYAQMVQSGRPERGIVFAVGASDEQLAKFADTGLRVIAADTDPTRVAGLRKAALAQKTYGSRFAAHVVTSYGDMPFTDKFADKVVLGEGVDAGLAAKYRTPSGGDGTGVWTHLYGLPDNSSYAGESLRGARGVGDLEVQWVGRPGPRAQPDRNGRKPSPLAVNGRLFHQGLQRLIALNAHNGTILWSLEIAPLGRFNMPRDCSNWCADDDYLYVAVKDSCWRIDAATGEVAAFHKVTPGPDRGWPYHWGYLARVGDHLIATAVKAGASHTNFWGGSGSGWYDSRGGEVTHPVCSEMIYDADPATGQPRWKYADGVILNPTISVAAGKVFFVECRHPKVLASESRRVGLPELWQQQYLTALDINTGKKLWDRPIKTEPGRVTFYMAHKDDTIVIAASQTKYHVYAFSDVDGEPLWGQSFKWQNADHGGHMSRPAIVGGKVYVRPRVLTLKTGKLLDETLPKGGCGTYACSDNTLIFRAGLVTVWDRKAAKPTQWPRLRPDCWLSTIPACGMLLSPEGGGGCSCGSWMETSLGFRPKQR